MDFHQHVLSCEQGKNGQEIKHPGKGVVFDPGFFFEE